MQERSTPCTEQAGEEAVDFIEYKLRLNLELENSEGKEEEKISQEKQESATQMDQV